MLFRYGCFLLLMMGFISFGQINAQAVADPAASKQSETQSIQMKIEQLEKDVDDLRVRQNHLNQMIRTQNKRLMDFDQQLKAREFLESGLIPLLHRMLLGYEQVITYGLPLQQAIRQQRLVELKALMDRDDVSNAEKYRRILEAYQIEIDYGMSIGRSLGEIQLTETDKRQVELLHIGYVTLIARSQDKKQAWLWREQDQRWHALVDMDMSELERAYAFAAQEQPPSLLTLPISLSKVFTTEGMEK